MSAIEFNLNGRAVMIEPRDGETLLETLRDRCGVRSTKDGCAPQGQCGCCLAIVGGRAVTTCATPVAMAAGKDILTLEPERTLVESGARPGTFGRFVQGREQRESRVVIARRRTGTLTRPEPGLRPWARLKPLGIHVH